MTVKVIILGLDDSFNDVFRILEKFLKLAYFLHNIVREDLMFSLNFNS